MYRDFYGLRERPFALTPDAAFLLLTRSHCEALRRLRHAVSGNAGLTLLVGEAGTGKTTILRAALETQPQPLDCVVTLDNPTLTRDEFLEFLAEGFHLGPEASRSKTRLLHELRRGFCVRHQAGGASVLIVDEAQGLSDELLEEIRLLANLETGTARLLLIVLAGQPDLAERLDDPALLKLRQRIELRAALAPLTLPETADYIAGRLAIAGGEAAGTFTRSAVASVFAHSGGIPRAINVICENALAAGFARALRPLDADVVSEVCQELGLRPSGVVERREPSANAAQIAPEARPTTGPEVVKRRGEERDLEAESAPRPARPRIRALWKRWAGTPLRLQTEYFNDGGQRGFLITPVAGIRSGSWLWRREA